MKLKIAFGILLALGATGFAAEPIKSGPQIGEKVPGPFKPLNLNGPDAGQEECLYCKNGSKPVVMIFVREFTPAVVSLIKKVDAATSAYEDASLRSCVIVLTDTKDAGTRISAWVKAEKISQTILATYTSTGPAKYEIAPDALVTVLLYSKQTVKANHCFRSGELTERTVDTVLSDISKILPR